MLPVNGFTPRTGSAAQPHTHVELPIISFICAVLVLSPFPWHWRARNIPTLSLIFWLAVVNIIRGINAIVWVGDDIRHAPYWCSITNKLETGAQYAYAAALVCVCRNLAHVCSPHYMIPNAAQRRAQFIFEIFMCTVWPVIGMALHYVVQGHRFDTMEYLGCAFVCAISLRWIVHRRTQFLAALATDSSGFTSGRHIRLVTLSATMMLSVTTMSVFTLVLNLERNNLQPWVYWDLAHSPPRILDQYATRFFPPHLMEHCLILWYMVPFASVIFFAFFGLGQQAKNEYARYISFMKTQVFRIKPKEESALPISAGRGYNNSRLTMVATSVIPESSPRTPISQQSESNEKANSPSIDSTSLLFSPAADLDKHTSLDVEADPEM